MNDLLTLSPSREEMERAFISKDRSYDGVFYVAVKTTGIFCRPSCPSRPNLQNVEFFASVKDCLFAGYRPCKRCHPLEANGKPPDWARELMTRIEAARATQRRGFALFRDYPGTCPSVVSATLRDELYGLVPWQPSGRGLRAA